MQKSNDSRRCEIWMYFVGNFIADFTGTRHVNFVVV